MKCCYVVVKTINVANFRSRILLVIYTLHQLHLATFNEYFQDTPIPTKGV